MQAGGDVWNRKSSEVKGMCLDSTSYGPGVRCYLDSCLMMVQRCLERLVSHLLLNLRNQNFSACTTRAEAKPSCVWMEFCLEFWKLIPESMARRDLQKPESVAFRLQMKRSGQDAVSPTQSPGTLLSMGSGVEQLVGNVL